MLILLLTGTLLIGYVDKVEEQIVTVEYQIEERIAYREVQLDPDKCIPVEGQQVLFSKEKIIACFVQIKYNKKE